MINIFIIYFTHFACFDRLPNCPSRDRNNASCFRRFLSSTLLFFSFWVEYFLFTALPLSSISNCLRLLDRDFCLVFLFNKNVVFKFKINAWHSLNTFFTSSLNENATGNYVSKRQFCRASCLKSGQWSAVRHKQWLVVYYFAKKNNVTGVCSYRISNCFL